MHKLYRVVLEDEQGVETVDWEYGEDEQEALELVLGRHGTSVHVTKAKLTSNVGLLEAAYRISHA